MSINRPTTIWFVTFLSDHFLAFIKHGIQSYPLLFLPVFPQAIQIGLGGVGLGLDSGLRRGVTISTFHTIVSVFGIQLFLERLY